MGPTLAGMRLCTYWWVNASLLSCNDFSSSLNHWSCIVTPIILHSLPLCFLQFLCLSLALRPLFWPGSTLIKTFSFKHNGSFVSLHNIVYRLKASRYCIRKVLIIYASSSDLRSKTVTINSRLLQKFQTAWKHVLQGVVIKKRDWCHISSIYSLLCTCCVGWVKTFCTVT